MPVTIHKKPRVERPPRKTGGKPQAIQWPAMRETFITKNLHPLNGRKYTLQDLAEEYNLNYAQVRNRSAKEKWPAQLDEAIQQRDVQVRKNVIEHRGQIARGVQSDEINAEVTVRKRQATIARMLYSKAAERLKSVKPEDLTIKEAIDLARVGLFEERKALGIPDKHEITVEKKEGDFLSMDRTKEILGRVIEMAEIEEGKYQEVGDAG